MLADDQADGLALECAKAICEAFKEYNADFRQITLRASQRFKNQDWKGSQRDAVERIELYYLSIRRTVVELQRRLGFLTKDRPLWLKIRHHYCNIILYYVDSEFYKTFYSSISRIIFKTVGVDPDVEFVALDIEPISRITKPVSIKEYQFAGSLQQGLLEFLSDNQFAGPYKDIERDAASIVKAIHSQCLINGTQPNIYRAHIMKPVFYQITRAYLIGNIYGANWKSPFVVAFKNSDDGVEVDAVLMTEADVGILFSYTRSYFHVDLETVGDAVVYLLTMMPLKTAGDLYTVLGRARQGKTDRYRNIFQHLEHTSDHFVHAPGDKGLVMVVFTMPSYDVVIKVIRDRFAYPKTTSRQDVVDRYKLVFEHDRAGRLADAQEFRHMKFRVDRFSKELLDELIGEAAETVRIDGDYLIIKHCYIEHRFTPLNLYLKKASRFDCMKVIYDYGQAIRDLALSNIFPGDLLLKNFGVTRRQRVIFYDYDELCMVTDCHFRDLPPAQSLEDEMASEAWFYVADNDIFPEQFISFLGFDDVLKEFFLKWHGEILTAEYWRKLQARHRVGEVIDVTPYHRYPGELNAHEQQQ